MCLHRLQCIATLVRTILMVTLSLYSLCMIWHFFISATSIQNRYSGTYYTFLVLFCTEIACLLNTLINIGPCFRRQICLFTAEAAHCDHFTYYKIANNDTTVGIQVLSAGSGVCMNGYATHFHETCDHPCIYYSHTQCIALLATTGIQCVWNRRCMHAQ
jgi:hypothetical protein